MITKNSAVALIFHKENVFFPIDIMLGVSRKYDHENFGLPGGKCEEGETFEECVRREVKEETGLIVTKCREIFELTLPHNGNLILGKTFLCEVEGEIHTDEPHVVKWVTWDTLFNGSFGQYNKELFNHLICKDEKEN
jgi:8-oxo-dGTP pyrophosphatase MutT (NUDIX family)